MGDDLARTCGHQRHLEGASHGDAKVCQAKPLLSFEDSNNNQKSELIKMSQGNKDSTSPQDTNAAGPDLGIQKIDSDLAEVFGAKGATGVSAVVDKSQPGGIESSDKLGLHQPNEPCDRPRASVLMR